MKTMEVDVGSSTWETNDLVEAATLKCYGFEPQSIRWDDEARSAYWQYNEVPELLAVIVNMALGRARVDPKKYNSYYVGVKDEMFDFMRSEGVRPRNSDR